LEVRDGVFESVDLLVGSTGGIWLAIAYHQTGEAVPGGGMGWSLQINVSER
jgi:hypothetical protein